MQSSIKRVLSIEKILRKDYTVRRHRSERSERRSGRIAERLRVMGEGLREVWVCQICGYEWLKSRQRHSGERPKRCASGKCRSSLWDRARRSNVGRPDRSVVKAKGHLPTLTANGEHSGLCSCLVCLWAIAGSQGATKGRTGVTKGRGGQEEGVSVRPSVSPVSSHVASGVVSDRLSV